MTTKQHYTRFFRRDAAALARTSRSMTHWSETQPLHDPPPALVPAGLASSGLCGFKQPHWRPRCCYSDNKYKFYEVFKWLVDIKACHLGHSYQESGRYCGSKTGQRLLCNHISYRKLSLSPPTSPCSGAALALVYGKADKLLNALPVLLLGGAAAGVLTWLAEGSVRFTHFLVHPSQP